jgi:hypothetical protein
MVLCGNIGGYMTNNYSDYLKFATEVGIISPQKDTYTRFRH